MFAIIFAFVTLIDLVLLISVHWLGNGIKLFRCDIDSIAKDVFIHLYCKYEWQYNI